MPQRSNIEFISVRYCCTIMTIELSALANFKFRCSQLCSLYRFELYRAMELNAQVTMCFTPEQNEVSDFFFKGDVGAEG